MIKTQYPIYFKQYIEYGIKKANLSDELLDFVRTNLHDIKKNRLDRVKASNFYNKFHDSDMHPEETDISKYFEIEQSVLKEMIKKGLVQKNNFPD